MSRCLALYDAERHAYFGRGLVGPWGSASRCRPSIAFFGGDLARKRLVVTCAALVQIMNER
jgi:hypothetical protein